MSTALPVSNDWKDLDDLDTAASRTSSPANAPTLVPCYACGGSGTKIIGYVHQRGVKCFTCNGTGKTKADAKKRKDAWRKGQQTQAENRQKRAHAYAKEHEAEINWLFLASSRGFEFATSLLKGYNEYGSLTEKQLTAVRNCMQKEAVRRETRQAEQAASAPQIGAGGAALLNALNQAATKGLEGLEPGQHRSQPKLRTEVATFSLAKPTSKNPGCVYVTAPDRLYLGKITPAGAFLKSQECTQDLETRILKVLENPLDAAVQYGRVSGTCSCCGRRLDNAESISLGIGPICREKMFGG